MFTSLGENGDTNGNEGKIALLPATKSARTLIQVDVSGFPEFHAQIREIARKYDYPISTLIRHLLSSAISTGEYKKYLR